MDKNNTIIINCVKTMDSISQKVLILRDCGKLSYLEISKKLNKPESEIKSILFKSRQKIKNSILNEQNR